MDVESYQRNTIDDAKQKIINEENDVLQKELDSLEQKNKTISTAKLSGAPISTSNLTDEERYKKYLQMKNESIFGDEDVKETLNSTQQKRAPTQQQKQEYSSVEEEPKIYEVTEEDLQAEQIQTGSQAE